jgi:hypothetical protein
MCGPASARKLGGKSNQHLSADKKEEEKNSHSLPGPRKKNHNKDLKINRNNASDAKNPSNKKKHRRVEMALSFPTQKKKKKWQKWHKKKTQYRAIAHGPLNFIISPPFYSRAESSLFLAIRFRKKNGAGNDRKKRGKGTKEREARKEKKERKKERKKKKSKECFWISNADKKEAKKVRKKKKKKKKKKKVKSCDFSEINAIVTIIITLRSRIELFNRKIFHILYFHI